jgi:hypothetical protein
LNAWPAGRRWLWIALAVLVCILQGPSFIGGLRPPRSPGVDFFQDWASARNYYAGSPIYSDHQTAVERYLGFRPDSVAFDVNAHPPSSVLLALPFAALDYPDAVLVWNLVSLGMLVISLWLIGRALAVRLTLWSIFPAVTLLLVFAPFRQQMLQGQFNLVLLLLLTGVWAAQRSGRQAWAGAFLGVASAIKLYPVLLILYFLLRRQWKAAIVSAVSLALVTLLTVAVLGVSTYRSYIYDVLPHVSQYRSCWNNASLPGLWIKLFNPATEQERVAPLWRNPLIAEGGALLSCLAVVVVFSWAVWNSRMRQIDDRGFGLAVTAMLLVSPITWEHYFLLLLPPVAILWTRLPSSVLAKGVFMMILVVLGIHPLLLYDTFVPGGVGHGFASPVCTLTVLSLQCYALLGLFAFLIVIGGNRHRTQTFRAPVTLARDTPVPASCGG